MSKRLLIVDDDEAIRKSFTLTLEDTGYQTETAASGEKAIEMARDTIYDLIFLDLKMPGIDGVQTLRELRKIDKDVPVYVVTAFHAEFLDQLKSIQEDGIEFELLRKPLGSAQLSDVARGVLEGPVVRRRGIMYEVKLYVMGRTGRSKKAIESLSVILEAQHKGQYSLKIIDVMENPQLAEMDMVFATPTVVKASPPPQKRIIGDLSKSENVLAGLGM